LTKKPFYPEKDTGKGVTRRKSLGSIISLRRGHFKKREMPKNSKEVRREEERKS